MQKKVSHFYHIFIIWLSLELNLIQNKWLFGVWRDLSLYSFNIWLFN